MSIARVALICLTRIAVIQFGDVVLLLSVKVAKSTLSGVGGRLGVVRDAGDLIAVNYDNGVGENFRVAGIDDGAVDEGEFFGARDGTAERDENRADYRESSSARDARATRNKSHPLTTDNRPQCNPSIGGSWHSAPR